MENFRCPVKLDYRITFFMHFSESIISWLETTASPRLARANINILDVRSAWLKNVGQKWIDLDGSQMRDWPSAYDCLSEAFELPDYFGRNLNALSECLSDQDVLQGTAFVVCIARAPEALVNANSDALAGLLDTLQIVADELSEPIDEGQQWDRPAIPFHVLLMDVGDDEWLQNYPATPSSPPSTQQG
jgi:RNAse (barnase) inhibitor barstar